MRANTQALAPFLELMRLCRPCPECGSERVTVREVRRDLLRAECADCGHQQEASRREPY